MAKKLKKDEDINRYKAEMLLHIICESCNKSALSGHDIMSVLLACMTEVAFETMSVEHTDKNFEEIADVVRKKFLEGLQFYRENEEKENGKESK